MEIHALGPGDGALLLRPDFDDPPRGLFMFEGRLNDPGARGVP